MYKTTVRKLQFRNGKQQGIERKKKFWQEKNLKRGETHFNT